MRKILFFLSFFSSLFIGCVSYVVAEDDTSFSSPIVEELLSIENKRLKYKGKFVPVPYTRNRLIEVFGKPSREIYNTAGTVVIWDELGLTCYGCHKQKEMPEDFQYMTDAEIKQSTHQDYVDSITIFVRRYNPYPERENKYSHEPQLPFPGKLLLDGVELDGIVQFNEFIEQREGKQTILLPENSFSFFIRCEPQPQEITLHTIRDKYDDDFMSIYSVSIRNIGHYYKNYKCVEIFEAPQPEQPETKPIADEDLPAPVDEDN